MTLRVYWEDSRKAALLAKVRSSGEGWFVADRTIFHAPDRAYGHDVPPDRGEILGGGHKAKVTKARVGRDGDVVHHVRGPSPPPGTQVQMHLDERRRLDAARAHALAHVLAACVVARKGELDGFPATTGGAQVRARARLRGGAGEVEALLSDVNGRLRTGERPAATHLPRADADRRVLAGSALPPHDVVRVVALAGASIACDAPLVRDLGVVGSARVVGAPRAGPDGVALVLRAVAS